MVKVHLPPCPVCKKKIVNLIFKEAEEHNFENWPYMVCQCGWEQEVSIMPT